MQSKMHNGVVEDHHAVVLEQLHVHCHDADALSEELSLAGISCSKGGDEEEEEEK